MSLSMAINHRKIVHILLSQLSICKGSMYSLCFVIKFFAYFIHLIPEQIRLVRKTCQFCGWPLEFQV